MGDYFLGEIRLFPYHQTPRNWLNCEGQSLPVRQYQALYALIGNIYGGDSTTFKLPDLRGRVPAGWGSTPASPDRIPPALGSALLVPGNTGGSEAAPLSLAQIPAHTHMLKAQPSNVPLTAITNSFPSTSTKPSTTPATAPAAPDLYAAPTSTVALNAASLAYTGGNVAHENRQPFLALRYCMSTSGLFPPRN